MSERQEIGGHLILLGLNEGGRPRAEYSYPVLSWADYRGILVVSGDRNYAKYRPRLRSLHGDDFAEGRLAASGRSP